MPKIEIDLEYVEALKAKNEEQRKEVIELKQRLDELSEHELNRKAVMYSFFLLNKYLNVIFKKLGFDDTDCDAVIFTDNLGRHDNEKWWTVENIDLNINALITSKFKHAFLKIGIITK